MSTLALLLRRDARLHWDALLIPALLGLGLGLSLAFLPERPAALPALFLKGAFGLGVFMSLAIHLREMGSGSLQDLRALPASSRTLVSQRWMEAFLLGLLTLIAALGPVLWLVPKGAVLPPLFSPSLGWALLWVFALPLAILLRWGQKRLGWYALLLIPAEVWGLKYIPAEELAKDPETPALILRLATLVRATDRPWQALGASAPLVEGLLVLALLALAFHLAVLALERSDA